MLGVHASGRQMRALLELAALDEPGPASPLTWVPPGPRLLEDDPDHRALVGRGLLVTDTEQPHSYRLNQLVRLGLWAALAPDEVVTLTGEAQGRSIGVTLVRRGLVWAECSVDLTGATLLALPLTRAQVLTVALAGLSGDRPEPAPTTLRVQVPPGPGFVLAAALRLEARQARPVSRDALHHAVAQDLRVPSYVGPFVALHLGELLDELRTTRTAVESAIEALLDAGYVVAHEEGLRPSPGLAEVLLGTMLATIVVTRTAILDGVEARRSLQVLRVRDRLVVFRAVDTPSGPLLDWGEVTRVQVRALVSALLVEEERLGDQRSVAPPHAPGVGRNAPPPVPVGAPRDDGPPVAPTTADRPPPVPGRRPAQPPPVRPR